MDLKLQGRNAIIAGGSAGMGKAAAMTLAGEGVNLFLSARNEERLNAAADEIRSATGATVVAVPADHSTVEGRAALLQACPQPDIAVITVSPPKRTPKFDEIDPQDWMDSFTMGMIGPMSLIQSLIPGMRERKFGRIVNIATMAAKFPVVLRLLSGPARTALIASMASISRKVARDNVIINNVLPGWYKTEGIMDELLASASRNGTTIEEEEAKIVARWRIPNGRLGDPVELAAYIALLCSPFSANMVGQSLVLDGGIGNSIF